MSVTIEVPIPDDLILLLDRKARTAGVHREQYIRALVFRDLARPRQLDEILAGFRGQVAARGMSDSELSARFHEIRDARTNP